MAKIYQTPGVYIEETSHLFPSIAQVETAIPVFIGYTEKSEEEGAALPSEIIDGITVTLPRRVTSLTEYEQYFGRDTLQAITVQINEAYTPVARLLKSVSQKQSIVVTASAVATMYNHMQVYFGNGGINCFIICVGYSATGSIAAANLLAGLKMAGSYSEPTLTVIPQVNQLPVVNDASTVYDTALQQATDLKDRFVLLDCYDDNPDNIVSLTGVDNLQYGAAYHPYLQFSFSNIISTDDLAAVKIILTKTSATGKEESTTVGFADLTADVQALVSSEIKKQNIILPPCSAMVGVYTRIDQTLGVWKSPANVSLQMINGLTKQINDADQDKLINPLTGKSVNAIRFFINRGIMVWGARTLDAYNNDWRYISVRRLFIMIEESAKNATSAFVSEPNNTTTWLKLQSMVENFLTVLWRAGALQGSKPQDAFYTAVGIGKTMTALDILNGQLIMEIGVAAIRPAEFIIIRFTQQMAQS
jgi:hypothetical protein